MITDVFAELKNWNSNYRTIIEDTHRSILYHDMWDYNCMGYALGVYDWLEIDAFMWLDEDEQDYEALQDNFEACCDELVREHQLIRIYDPSHVVSLAKDSHLIAFRIGFDDFHFARLNSDGVWTHKPGGSQIRELTPEEFNQAWCPHRSCPYISDIAYFIVQKGRYDE